MRATLAVEVIGDLLVISISAKALAFAVNSSDYAQPFIHARGEHITSFEVTDPVGFIEDVAFELQSEREDGSTLVTGMLDAAARLAAENGSECITQPEE
jgi:hypothetical protein